MTEHRDTFRKSKKGANSPPPPLWQKGASCSEWGPKAKRERRRREALLGGSGGMPPPEKFENKSCQKPTTELAGRLREKLNISPLDIGHWTLDMSEVLLASKSLLM